MADGVFLDIGAHSGQTLRQALAHGFDHIYAFEPMPREFDLLQATYGDDPRVTLLNYGLSNVSGCQFMYGTNDSYEASVYRTSWVAADADETICRFVDASEWFDNHLTDDAPVYCKINCEGSEVDILSSLLASGQIWKVAAMLVAFDIALVESEAHREHEVRNDLTDAGFHRLALMAAYKKPTYLRDWLADLRVVV